MSTSTATLAVTSSARTPFFASFLRIGKSPKHLIFSAAIAAVALGALMMTSLAVGAVAAAAADAYLLAMLWCATIQSTGGPETSPGLPYRETAIFVVLLVFATLVLAFAAIYRSQDPSLGSAWAATYFSLVSFATFSYVTSPQPATSLAVTMAAQALSAVTLLICALPLLVSRLTNVDSTAIAAKEGTPVIVAFNAAQSWSIKSVQLRMGAGEPELFIELEPGVVVDAGVDKAAPARA
jgi:hypothetical protein